MYTHYAKESASWRVPIVSRVFALARQVNPRITLLEFYQLGIQTGIEINGSFLVQPIALIDEIARMNERQNQNMFAQMLYSKQNGLQR